jgi:opacity protein-like surface antigen
MKIITKLFITATIAVSTFSSLHAQDSSMMMGSGLKFKFGVGASVSLTNPSSPFSYGLGADVRAQLWLAPAVALTASGGYTRLVAKDNSTIAAYSYIPVVGGIKIYPVKWMYLNGFAGVGLAVKDSSETAAIYGGGLGFELNKGWELGFRYEANEQDKKTITYSPILSQYAVRVGYNF